MQMMMIDDLIPGMVVAQDVLNQLDAVIIPTGMQLTQTHIQMLQQLNVDFIFIEESKSQIIDESTKKVPKLLMKREERERKLFERSVEFYKNIYEDSRQGRPIHYPEVFQMVSEIVKEFFSHDDVIRVLQRIEIIDEYEYGHGTSVCILSVVLAKWLEMEQQQIYKLAVAAYVSDIGKSKVSKSILSKEKKLNDFESIQAKRHVVYSKNILEFSGGFDPDVIKAVYQHHERMNGLGYPDQKNKEDISIEARIIAVADTFHALMSERPYREAYTVFEATEILWKLAYKELDPKVSERLVKFITAYFVGRKVILSDGRVGEIILVNPYDRFKPLVKVDDNFIDLSQDKAFKIVGVVNLSN